MRRVHIQVHVKLDIPVESGIGSRGRGFCHPCRETSDHHGFQAQASVHTWILLFPFPCD